MEYSTRAFLLIASLLFLFGCDQINVDKFLSSTNGRVNCLVPGYDSLIYYKGSSKNIRGIQRGTVSDEGFVTNLLQMAKEEGLVIVLKPGGGANTVGDLAQMRKFASDRGIRTQTDTIDHYEEKVFGFSTAPQLKDAFLGKPAEELHLALPRDNDTSSVGHDSLGSSSLSVLFSTGETVYAYRGSDMKSGKKYTLAELKDLIGDNKADTSFLILLKPSKNGTYKSTVNMLDLMTTAGQKKYALVDISKSEEDYLEKMENR